MVKFLLSCCKAFSETGLKEEETERAEWCARLKINNTHVTRPSFSNEEETHSTTFCLSSTPQKEGSPSTLSLSLSLKGVFQIRSFFLLLLACFFFLHDETKTQRNEQGQMLVTSLFISSSSSSSSSSTYHLYPLLSRLSLCRGA